MIKQMHKIKCDKAAIKQVRIKCPRCSQQVTEWADIGQHHFCIPCWEKEPMKTAKEILELVKPKKARYTPHPVYGYLVRIS